MNQLGLCLLFSGSPTQSEMVLLFEHSFAIYLYDFFFSPVFFLPIKPVLEEFTVSLDTHFVLSSRC